MKPPPFKESSKRTKASKEIIFTLGRFESKLEYLKASHFLSSCRVSFKSLLTSRNLELNFLNSTASSSITSNALSTSASRRLLL
eukprot:UN13831